MIDELWFERKKTPEKLTEFKVNSKYSPAGDQVQAIEKLSQGIDEGKANQVLLGVTGSGKTYTMAKVIEKIQRPAIIMAHNKTLAAQLYEEMRNFFPNNHVEYFVSFYDYYQPEAYVPRTDQFIEKDSSKNEQIERMRHSATRSILEYGDTIIVASVSAIYGIGDVETYMEMTQRLEVGEEYEQRSLIARMVELQYDRNSMDLYRGSFRVRGDVIDVFPSHLEDRAWRLDFFGDELESIQEFDPLTGKTLQELEKAVIFPNSHYVTPKPTVLQAMDGIKFEMEKRVYEFEQQNKLIEAQRIRERTHFDLEMMDSIGYCSGIENYSRYLTGREPGNPPPTLFEYLPEDTILFMDESHVSVPQIGGMYKGDRSRKLTLAEYGFRLPSCVDNRPLQFEEWDIIRPQTIFVSATPAPWEIEQADNEVVEQVIRPTGLIDPICEVRPVTTQVDDLLDEIHKQIAKKERTLVTTLTKKMAEQLTEYYREQGIKVRYMHSDIDTIERIEIIRDLRLGAYDVLVGINLLREGLDIPECSLVAILDADKEGFLRSKTSLVQTIGRAARNVNGRVLLYADKMTKSLDYAIDETNRRREIQHQYNLTHNITPTQTKRAITDITGEFGENVTITDIEEAKEIIGKNLNEQIKSLETQMKDAASNLDFELATKLRDKMHALEKKQLY